jgi:archaemetzincin
MAARPLPRRLAVVAPLSVPRDLLDSICAALAQRYALEAAVHLPALDVPPLPGFWLGGQLLANRVIDLLAERFRGESCLALAVVSVDITIPIMRYVLGQAEMGGSFSVISLARISEGNLSHRAESLAIHEVGHLFDLAHCEDPACAMFPVVSTVELDRRGVALCRYCTADLATRVSLRPRC